MYQLARKICGYNELKASVVIQERPKDLVGYDDLVAAINEYRDIGDPDFRDSDDKKVKKSLEISKLFGLFMTLAVITAQRNRTIREIKFEDFGIRNGVHFLYTYATKTHKPSDCDIDGEIVQIVDIIKEQRRWTIRA